MKYAIFNEQGILEVREDSNIELPVGAKQIDNIIAELFSNAATKEEQRVIFNSIP